MTTEQLRELFYPDDPFAAFDAARYPLKVKGWHSDRPIFKELIERQQPGLYIEVGTWLGASAIHVASLLEEAGIECPVLCIDTWLGAQEFWQDCRFNERYADLAIEDGYPTVFRQFMANVVHSGHAARIVPLPQTSLIAARLLAAHRLQAGLIYIDCSHDEGDVLRDLEAYWEVLAPGGILFGDDYDEFWPGLVHDVNRFAADKGLQVEQDQGTWVLQKPANSAAKAAIKAADERDLRIALETENAILRSRMYAIESQLESVRLERDKVMKEWLDRLHAEEARSGYFASIVADLERQLGQIAGDGGRGAASASS